MDISQTPEDRGKEPETFEDEFDDEFDETQEVITKKRKIDEFGKMQKVNTKERKIPDQVQDSSQGLLRRIPPEDRKKFKRFPSFEHHFLLEVVYPPEHAKILCDKNFREQPTLMEEKRQALLSEMKAYEDTEYDSWFDTDGPGFDGPEYDSPVDSNDSDEPVESILDEKTIAKHNTQVGGALDRSEREKELELSKDYASSWFDTVGPEYDSPVDSNDSDEPEYDSPVDSNDSDEPVESILDEKTIAKHNTQVGGALDRSEREKELELSKEIDKTQKVDCTKEKLPHGKEPELFKGNNRTM